MYAPHRSVYVKGLISDNKHNTRTEIKMKVLSLWFEIYELSIFLPNSSPRDFKAVRTGNEREKEKSV
jgi:hypothetical protein